MYVIQHAYRDGRLGICKHKVRFLHTNCIFLLNELKSWIRGIGYGFLCNMSASTSFLTLDHFYIYQVVALTQRAACLYREAPFTRSVDFATHASILLVSFTKQTDTIAVNSGNRKFRFLSNSKASRMPASSEIDLVPNFQGIQKGAVSLKPLRSDYFLSGWWLIGGCVQNIVHATQVIVER